MNKFYFALISLVVLTSCSFAKKEEWVALKKGPMIEAIYGLSTVTSEREFKVKTGIATTLSKVFVKEGAIVRKGDPLLQFIDQPQVRAPFDGTVTEVSYLEGENVFPQMAILTLVDLKSLYLSMSVEQSSALMIRKDQVAEVSFESQRNQKVQGKVSVIVPKEGQFMVHILVDRLPEGVLPGMTADTSITVGQKENITQIPLKALQGFHIKLRMKGGKVEKKEAKLGIISGEWGELITPELKNPEQMEVLVTP
jgi:multidrug efflux pump subunit AcrA (membrane-fusion protein)